MKFLSLYMKSKKDGMRGFVLPLTLVVCVIILTIATGISIILAKELYFSRLSRLSQVAYYAADNGLMCATMVDDSYTDPETGLGIFQWNTLVTSQDILDKVNVQRVSRGFQEIDLADIRCATSAVFDQSISNIELAPFSRTDAEGNPESGQTTTFNMRMDLGDDGYRCATVIINKTTSYRQIISRGFASCGNTAFGFPIERAIVSTAESVGFVTESGGGSGTTTEESVALTSSSGSWVVPESVTSIKVWAIGGGGGGAGSPSVDTSAGGGGAAGGVAYKVFSVTPGTVISYTTGASGLGGSGAVSGGMGGATSVTVNGISISGNGGYGGLYNAGSPSSGGSTTGSTDLDSVGGAGAGSSGDDGGGGGGGIGGVNGTQLGNLGGNGGQAVDVAGLFAVVTSLGYSTTAPGVGAPDDSSPQNEKHGGNATGFGSGGGGAGWYGGNGGNGLYGGGGGGAAGYSAAQIGGNGGQGIVIISTQ